MALDEGFREADNRSGQHLTGDADQGYDLHTLNSSSLQYQEINYSQQNRNQRLLNTLENQDHLVIQALYQKDMKLNMSSSSSRSGNSFERSNKQKEITMKVIGSSYDKNLSIERAKHNILKTLVDKN